MNPIADYFAQAELALASYANLFSGDIVGANLRALEQAGMSEAQASSFANDWRVVTQYNHTEQLPTYDDAGNLTGYVTSSNGLSVTVFEEVGSGKGGEKVSGTFSGRRLIEYRPFQ